jgi:predicted ATP-grasp superfamily ATP-dependent carboligase
MSGKNSEFSLASTGLESGARLEHQLPGTRNPAAIILGGGFGSLAAARSLAKNSIKVCVVAPHWSVARFSRCLTRFIASPSVRNDQDLVEHLVKMAREYQLRGSVLFPSSDEQVRILAQNRSRLSEHYVVTTPSWETIQFLYDKRLTYDLAQRAGVAMPRTQVPENAERLAALNLDFPLILKPAASARFVSTTNRKAYRADNLKELQTLYAQMSGVISAAEVLVQDLLPDPSKNLFSYAGYFRNGEPLVGLSAKRHRQLPPDFGRSSTFVEAVEIPELKGLARQLLQCIGYTGLAEVEFMWNPKKDRFELLEVNPRLWAWHSLASAAGLDLPYVAFTEALGRTVTVGTPRQGAKWLRFITDVRAAAQGICSGSLGLREYLASLRGTTAFAVFSSSDPLPFLVEPLVLLLNRFHGQDSNF